MKSFVTSLFALSLLIAMSGCPAETKPAGGDSTSMGSDAPADYGNDSVKIDGSSTVFPISQIMAEELKNKKNLVAEVGLSGTGGGFDKFVRGDIDISDASRPIKDGEADKAKAANIEFVELKVAIDGLSVVVHKENTWVDCMSVEDLKKIWEPGSTITKWNQINPEWPDAEIKLYGPDSKSGTYDYFAEAIVEGKKLRDNYTPAVNDNQLVQGVTGDKNALGFFGFAYYVENTEKLKALSIKKGAEGECVAPTKETILGGTYKPLSRPLYIYVNKAALKRPVVKDYVSFYMNEGQALVPEVGYVQLPEAELKVAQDALKAAME
jgi:phosphate transport system substrate-binding protein